MENCPLEAELLLLSSGFDVTQRSLNYPTASQEIPASGKGSSRAIRLMPHICQGLSLSIFQFA